VLSTSPCQQASKPLATKENYFPEARFGPVSVLPTIHPESSDSVLTAAPGDWPPNHSRHSAFDERP